MRRSKSGSIGTTASHHSFQDSIRKKTESILLATSGYAGPRTMDEAQNNKRTLTYSRHWETALLSTAADGVALEGVKPHNTRDTAPRRVPARDQNNGVNRAQHQDQSNSSVFDL